MVVDERTRHGLFEQLIAVLGEEHAVTLMEHLPPVGWADVATKRDLMVLKGDLDALEERLRAEISRLDERIGAEMTSMRHELVGLFRAELAQALAAQTKTLMFMVLGALTGMGGLVFAAARL
ncbi:MAG: hypothetical protein ACRDYA_11665 [Egibacteraceae bacterium]